MQGLFPGMNHRCLKTDEIWGALIVQTLLIAVVLAWVWMIALGVIHAQILPAVIPAGYGVLFFPALGLTLVVQTILLIKALVS